MVTCAEARPARRAALERLWVAVLEAPVTPAGALDLAQVLALLAARGLTRVLVEGGSELAAALLRARLVDRLVWFQAPLLIGGDGLPALGALAADALAECLNLRRSHGLMLARGAVQAYIVDKA